jgi:hypothetical protein
MRYAYHNVVQDGGGNFVAGATITVYLAGGTTKASIYAAFTGGVADTDSVIATDSTGTYEFYVDEADYATTTSTQMFKVVMTKSGYTSETWDYVKIFPGMALDEPQEWTAQQNFNEATIASINNSTAWDLDTKQCAYIDLATAGENTTVANPTNMNAGATYVLRVEGDGSSSLAFGAAFEWGESSAPSAPAANGDILVCSFYSDGSTMYGGKFCLVEA